MNKQLSFIMIIAQMCNPKAMFASNGCPLGTLLSCFGTKPQCSLESNIKNSDTSLSGIFKLLCPDQNCAGVNTIEVNVKYADNGQWTSYDNKPAKIINNPTFDTPENFDFDNLESAKMHLITFTMDGNIRKQYSKTIATKSTIHSLSMEQISAQILELPPDETCRTCKDFNSGILLSFKIEPAHAEIEQSWIEYGSLKTNFPLPPFTCDHDKAPTGIINGYEVKGLVNEEEVTCYFRLSLDGNKVLYKYKFKACKVVATEIKHTDVGHVGIHKLETEIDGTRYKYGCAEGKKGYTGVFIRDSEETRKL